MSAAITLGVLGRRRGVNFRAPHLGAIFEDDPGPWACLSLGAVASGATALVFTRHSALPLHSQFPSDNVRHADVY
jgi:hypothetical protein